ncbi:MAG: DoxX family membrane protein, partial [Propionibacteriales bacterium]|nr:DoxX family membrane protein [Propionibacteriales bacterium]
MTVAEDETAGVGSRVQPWASLLVRLALAAVLIAAGVLKVVDPPQAVQAVAAYEIVPAALTPVVGFALPWLEIALGLLLVVGLATRVTAAMTAVLMVVFIIGVGSAWARGL